MSKDLEGFKRGVRADLQLIWAGQADGNKRIDEIARRIEQQSSRIEEQGEQIAEQGQQIAEQGQQIAAQGQQIAVQGQRIAEQGKQIAQSMRETARIGREVVALGDQMVGRLKQFDKRFGGFIDAVIKEVNQRAPIDRMERLEERVRKLEEERGPAA